MVNDICLPIEARPLMEMSSIVASYLPQIKSYVSCSQLLTSWWMAHSIATLHTLIRFIQCTQRRTIKVSWSHHGGSWFYSIRIDRRRLCHRIAFGMIQLDLQRGVLNSYTLCSSTWSSISADEDHYGFRSRSDQSNSRRSTFFCSVSLTHSVIFIIRKRSIDKFKILV